MSSTIHTNNYNIFIKQYVPIHVRVVVTPQYSSTRLLSIIFTHIKSLDSLISDQSLPTMGLVIYQEKMERKSMAITPQMCQSHLLG